MIQILCKKKHISMSSLIKKMVEDWLEEYEDMLLARRAEEAEKRWEEAGRPTHSFEEVWNNLCT